MINRKKTIRVPVGNIGIGGTEPIRIQSMTNTPTENAELTACQIIELTEAGSELVRITVNTKEAAEQVLEIKKRVQAAGCNVPIIGDFHYNGHLLLTQFPDMAKSLDKYRINPGNVGRGESKDSQFSIICRVAKDFNKPVRIGINSGSLDSELVEQKMRENQESGSGKSSEDILNECMILSALNSIDLALKAGLREDQLIVSCKTSSVQSLLYLYRQLAKKTTQPLHLGLTEAGMGAQGIVSSSAALAILLEAGIGDTIRVSITPKPGQSRTEEVLVAARLLQSLGIRQFFPTVIACPGCGRTTSTVFQELASEVEQHVQKRMNEWKTRSAGVEKLKIAVMGCIVNGPGESKNADIGISLPGAGEEPNALVYVEGKREAVIKGDQKIVTKKFIEMIETYVENLSR